MTVPVSVIVITYQSEEDIVPCLLSVLASDVDLELIVIDNGSTDRSVERARRVIQGRSDCSVVCNSHNVGFARAVNMGLCRARGYAVLLLNPDCVLERPAIPALLDALHADPAAAVAGGMLLNEDGSEQAGARRHLPTPGRALVRVLQLHRLAPRWSRSRGFLMNHEPLPEHAVPVDATSGAFMLVRRSAIADVGMLDEGYFMHCEDLDWCVRFLQHGWTVLFVPQARTLHKKGGSTRHSPVRVEYHKHRGMVRFYRKFLRRRYPELLTWTVMAGVWFHFALKAVWMSAAALWRGSAPPRVAHSARIQESAEERIRPYSR